MYLFKTLYYSIFCHTESYHPVQIASKVLYMVFKDKNMNLFIYQEKDMFYFHDLAGAR